ncbi:protein DDI1 homolog 2-like [Ptychodera flava]|uniref:protein DDI1 homolog 2-like n=1 Tax=Ptychodera flava TaxID=63121 RepID=UPI00396A88D3
MKVTVTTLTGEIFPLEVSADLELENFKALCEYECGFPCSEMMVLHNGIPLMDDKKTLEGYKIGENDVLLIQRMRNPAQMSQPMSDLPQIDFSNIQVPGTSSQARGSPRSLEEDPAALRAALLANPHHRALLKERNPPLSEALESGDLEKFTNVMRSQQREKAERERERIRLMNADPFDAEAQQHIAEDIRLKNVEANMESAMEWNPESFGQVVMLYIDCKVNGHDVKAFVDSGAQMTIMSAACAERCNIMRLVDRRWAGIAKGVGTQKIIGRVHMGQIQIGPDYLQSSFSILEDQPMDMLLGLDMLKRHQCSIDLKRNMLTIGTTGTETTFLSEGDLPPCARLNRAPSVTEDEDKQLAEAMQRSAEEASAGPSSVPDIPEEKVNQIVQMGFPRELAIKELRKSNGDVNQAAAAILAKSLQGP